MDHIFGLLKQKYPRCIFIYMDDILIATKADEEFYQQIIYEVLDLLAREDFYLKLSKCLFHQGSIDYLGIQINGRHIKIDPTKLHGLADWREILQNMHEVRSTLGAFRYNHPFVPGYSDIIRPLSNLTKKDVPFEWTPACTNTIRKLKAIIRTDPILRRPDHDKPFFLEVDASQYALGAVLSQKNEWGKLQLVGYFSKTLIPAKCNYNVYNHELLALVRALENWRHLLLGAKHQVKVFTDHEGLTKC